MKQIIMKELGIWQTAYPRQKKLLEDFANKIYFELRFKFQKKMTHDQIKYKEAKMTLAKLKKKNEKTNGE